MSKLITKLRLNNKVLLAVLGLAVFALLIASGYIYWLKKDNNQNQEISQQTTATNTEIQNKENESIESGQKAPASTGPPQVPSFNKSSGNNGSVPTSALINFICNSEPGTTCQMILASDSKQILLPDQPVKDNSRGQWFASWDWESVSGKWSVFARAKNNQGATSDSTKQTLEVK